MTDTTTLISVIVPVGSRVDDIDALFKEYAAALEAAGAEFEMIAVLDGPRPETLQHLQVLAGTESWLRIFQFSRPFGESAALMAGFDEAKGDTIISLPAYWQVDPPEIGKLIASLTSDDDMMIAVRWPRSGSTFERIRRGVFHNLLRLITGVKHRDLGCSVRIFRRLVADEIPLYGDQHRFLPVLAVRRGFRVREVELRQSPHDLFKGRYRLREYLHRLLDILTVFFLVRFTKKPLRFFGSLGFLTAGFGGIAVLVLVFQKLVYGMPLADRPALLLSSLLVVLGVQMFAIGLLGELVIFSNAGDSKEYAIRSITELGGPDSVPEASESRDESALSA